MAESEEKVEQEVEENSDAEKGDENTAQDANVQVGVENLKVLEKWF